MPNYFDQFDEAGGTPAPAESNVGNFFDQFDEPTNARPDRTLLGTAKDIGITALKGAINLPQAFVGLGDIATGGRVGKYLEEAGYRPEDAKRLLDEGLSPAQQYANQQVDNAQGFGGTLEALKDNPSAVATTVGESLPQMLGGAGIARGLLTTAPRMAPLVAGAVGEGAVAAGSSAEQIRNKTEDGLLTPGQQVAAALSGVGTAGLGVLGGKFAQKLGIGDMDTALAGGLADTRRNFFTRLAGQGITEGIFEEMPQSAQEQMWQNFALGKPLDEGVSEAAATGLAAGSLTGAGFEAGRTALGGFENRTQPSAVEDQLLDDGADQPAQANDQGADQQPQALGYSPQRMITMPDGTTAWEGDLQQQRQQLGEAPPAARNHPGFSELHKTADQIEAELGSGLDIDSEIAALENDLNLIQYQPAPIRNMDGRGQTITIDATGKRVKTTLQDDPVQPFATNGSEIDYTPEGPPAANADTGLSLADQNGIDYQPNADYQDPAKINQLSGSLENQMADYAKSQRLSVLPQGFDDERLARDEYRNILEGLGNQLTPGGDISYTRDGQDRITGRTSSVNPDWFKNLPAEEKLSVVDTQDAIKKALAGQKLGVRQTRLVKRLLDEASGVRSNQAEHLKAQRQETKRARFEALKSFWDEMPDTGNDPFGIHQENVAELFNEDNYEPEASYDDRSIAEMASQAEAMGADWRDVDKALDSGDSARTIQALSQLIYGLRNEHRPTRTTPNSAAPGAAQAGDVQPGRGEAPVESMAGESADLAQPAETGRAGEVAPAVKESLPVAPAISNLESATPVGSEMEPTAYETKDAAQSDIDAIANEAATSPANDLPEPTQAMKDAGNYRKGHLRLHGLDIAIENPRGSIRRGTDKGGKAWETEMAAHYGYVKRTTGADGDAVDVFIGDKPESDKVFVIDQYHPDGTFDEHKAVMGAGSMLEAKSLYRRNYQKGWKVGPTTAMSVDEFKAWLKDGDTSKPLSAPGNLPVQPREESSISIPPQPNNDAASSDNLARGEKSASKEQRNDPDADALSKEGNSQKNIPPESPKPKSKKSLGQQRSEKILGATIGDKVIPSADTGYLTGGTTYEIQRISKSGEVDFKNTKTGGGTSLSLGEMNNAERAGVVFEVVRGEKPKSGHRKTESAEAPKDYGDSLFDDPQYSLADSVGEQQVGEIIARIQSSFGAKLKITAVSSAVELPPEVQAHMEKNGIAGNKVKGVFHGGGIYVNREALQTAQDVETVILHELAHVGLAKMFGADIQAAMGSLYLAMGGDKTLRELATKYAMPLEKYQAAYASAKPAERLGFMTEELLAHIAENNKPSVKRFLKELIGAIRSWLRSKGFLSSAELSESELFALLKEVRQFAAADGNGIRYSLNESIGKKIEVDGVMRPTTNSKGQKIHPAEEGIKNFWRWFGDSKVVDEQGRPRAVYHGTSSDFTEFKVSPSGEYGAGIYLSYRPESASKWGAVAGGRGGEVRVMPLYVKMDKPYSTTKADIQELALEEDSDGEPIGMREVRRRIVKDGYDGIIGTGLSESDIQLIAFSSGQIKSSTGNTGEFNPDNPDIRYSLGNESTRPSGGFSLSGVKKAVTDAFKSEQRLAADRARENLPGEIRDSLDRLGDPRTVRARVRDAARRWLTPSGLLTKDVHKLKLERDGQLNGDEFHASILLQGFYDAVKEGYQKEYEYLVPATKARLNQAMRGEDVRIPEQVKTAIAHMRDQIKRLSAVHMEQLLDDAAALEAQGDDAGAAAKLRLAETIAGNFETYLHRSYRAFDDPDWPNKVRKNHPEVYAAAVNYLANGYADGGPVTREHLDLAKKKVALMLEEGTAFDSLGAFISESKLGAKDLSIIKRRKTIAPEILALLGEYEDAPINYTKSVAKMSRLVYNHAFLKKLREHGFEAGLFSESQNTNLGHNKKLAGDASEAYAPLNGLYTTHEFHQALVDAMGKETEMWWYRQLVSINGMVKFGKTVLSPTTALRNLYSAMFFSLTNGHFDFSRGKNFSWSTYFKGKPDALAYMEKLRRLGVVYDNPYAGEMMALLKDSRLDETVFNWKPFKWTKTGIDYAQKFYGFGDDLWKIIGFENEKAMLIKHKGMSEAVAEVEAAERIRNTYPTYSLIPKAVNALRRFPLVGTFVSFPAEVIRTSYHIVRYFSNDIRELGIKSPMVQRKAVGLLIAGASMYALQAITKALVGVDDDEEKALRLMSPEWQKNSNLAYLGRDEKGALQTMDMSFLDPYGYFKRPFNALLQDQPLGDALKSGVKDLLSPFFGQDITFGAIMDIAVNQKDTGGRVFNPQDTVANQTLDISAHMAKAVQPGIVSNITRMYMAATGKVTASGKKFDVEDELAALAGFRWGTFDPKTALYYQTFAFTDAKADASRVLTDTLKDPNKVDEEELREAFDTAMKARKKAYERMGTIVSAAEKSGLSRLQVIKILRDSGLSRDDANALVNGKLPEWRLSKSKAGMKRARILFSDEVARELKAREQLVNKWRRE